MYQNSFSFKKKEGKNFAKFSGDYNVIHINEHAGYNSIYGENIVHGVFVIFKFLEKIKIKNNFNYLKILFNDATKYNHKINIRKTKINNEKKLYELVQLNNVIAKIEVGFLSQKNKLETIKKTSLKKKYFINKKEISKRNFVNIDKNLNIALCKLSNYVGMIFPGENSLISEINISKVDFSYKKNLLINSDSSLTKKGFPIIYNNLKYGNYDINFKTLIRPKLKVKLNKPKAKILKQVKSIKENVLIIGASSGIGNDLLNLFINNNKIKVIGTYYKNKILNKKKNLIIKRVNVEKNLSSIFSIIKKYNPLTIYYFPTPKILFRSFTDKSFINLYKKYFINIPIKIIKFSNNYKCRFFYPSTTFKNNLSPYSIIKLKAEIKIKKLKNNKVRINIAKIPGINTRQTLSLFNKNLPNFRDLISINNEIFKKVFFKN
tara:strand:- start:97 stop:1395 length:1299 start_codon:yes stop_codon:yes gene_type:complete